ncbi:hypothetical protein TrRE_jg9474, partial [Triparma retinervis]
MSSWEDDDEEVDSGYMSTSTFTLIMSYLIPLFFTSVFFWLAISIFRKPSASEQAETEYKRHERAASEAEASEGGMLQKVAKTVRRAIVGDGAFLYGGFNDSGFLSDLHYYNGPKFEWREVKQGLSSSEPGSRVHVRAECAGGFLVMFGGSSQKEDCTDDLFVMDIRKSPLAWRRAGGGEGDDADAPRPKPRYGHAMCGVGDVVVVMGGLGEGETYLNDMWVLDTKGNFSWEYVKPGGSYWPRARDSHAMCALEDEGMLVLWGGFDGASSSVVPPGVIETFDFGKATWEETVTCGEGPGGG